MKGRKGKKESTTVKSEMEREREGVIYQHRGSLENGEKRGWMKRREKEGGRGKSSSRGRDPLLRGFRRPKSRVPKSTIPSPLDMACRPIFTIPRLPTSPFGFSLINSSNSRAGCLEFVEGVWERVHQSVCKSNHRKWIRYLLMTHSGNPSQSFTFASSRPAICGLTWKQEKQIVSLKYEI